MLIAAVCKCAIISLPLGEKNHPIAKMIRKLRKPLSAADDKNVMCQDVLVMLISLSPCVVTLWFLSTRIAKRNNGKLMSAL